MALAVSPATRRRRLARGIAANLFALASRILVQLATLPVLFAAWPGERVGSWLALFAIPSYIALIGNGFAGAGGSAALAAAQAGDWDRARADFRSAWAIGLVGTLALSVLFVVAGAPLSRLFAEGLSGIGEAELRPALIWLGIYILAVSQTGMLDIAYRVAGRYPTQIVITSSAALIEVAAILATVRADTTVVELAMILALVRIAVVVPAGLIAMRTVPQLFRRGRAAIGASMRDLWRPSLALMLVPLIFGINLQGYVLLVGASYGALAVAAFSATRTLVRLLDFLVNLAYGVQYYEAGYTADDSLAQERRQLATMTLAMLVTSGAFALVLELFGPALQAYYTIGATAFDRGVAGVLLAAGTLRALAATPMALIVAGNRHEGIVVFNLAASALALMLASGLALLDLPLALVLTPLLLAEASQTVPAFAAALGRLGLTWRAFLGLLVSPERIADLAAVARLVRRSR